MCLYNSYRGHIYLIWPRLFFPPLVNQKIYISLQKKKKKNIFFILLLLLFFMKEESFSTNSGETLQQLPSVVFPTHFSVCAILYKEKSSCELSSGNNHPQKKTKKYSYGLNQLLIGDHFVIDRAQRSRHHTQAMMIMFYILNTLLVERFFPNMLTNGVQTVCGSSCGKSEWINQQKRMKSIEEKKGERERRKK